MKGSSKAIQEVGTKGGGIGTAMALLGGGSSEDEEGRRGNGNLRVDENEGEVDMVDPRDSREVDDSEDEDEDEDMDDAGDA